jgi:hypothetical protein
MIQKFIYLALFSIIMLQFFGCTDEDIITDKNDNTFTNLSGTIDNWPQLSNNVLKLGIPGSQSFLDFGTSIIDLNGNFGLNTNTPSSSFTSRIIDWFNVNSTMNLQIQNYETKGIHSYLNILSDSGTVPIGEVMFSSDLLNTGEGYFSASYFYSEGDFQLVGSVSTEHNSENFIGTEDTYYNLHFKKGWNKLVYKVLQKIKSGDIITYIKDEWVNTTTSDGKWYYRFY